MRIIRDAKSVHSQNPFKSSSKYSNMKGYNQEPVGHGSQNLDRAGKTDQFTLQANAVSASFGGDELNE